MVVSLGLQLTPGTIHTISLYRIQISNHGSRLPTPLACATSPSVSILKFSAPLAPPFSLWKLWNRSRSGSLIFQRYGKHTIYVPSDMRRFIWELPCLERLHVKNVAESLNLSSKTVKTLQISCGWSLTRVLQLKFPALEHLDLSIDVEFANVVRFQADFPALKAAVVRLVNFQEKHVPALGCILRNMQNISSLRLGILPLMVNSNPYNISLEPEKEPPMLPNLKSFDLCTCIWHKTLEDLICLLEYMPAIEILKLTRLDPIDKPRRLDRFRLWPSQPFGSNELIKYFSWK